MKRNNIKSNKRILRNERWFKRYEKKRSPFLDILKELHYFHNKEEIQYLLGTMLGYCL